jgi:hypothetical protein
MTIVNTSARKAALPAIIATRLDEVRRREASLRLTTGLLDALALFLVVLFAALVVDWEFTLFSTSARATLTCVALGAGGIGLLLLAVVPWFKPRTLTEMAAQVDRSVPGLEERWATVTGLNESSEPETIIGSPALIDRVVAESVERNRLVDPQSIVPRQRLRKHQWLLAAAIGANLILFLIDPAETWVLLRRFCAPASPVSLTQVTAASGDLAVPRGEPVRLEATLAGRPREKADLFLRDAQGQVTSLSLPATDADGTKFGHAIEVAEAPFSYLFRAGDGETTWHDVAIYDRPRLTSVALKLQPPDYTHLPAVTNSELPTSLRAVEGSQLELGFSVDQPLDHFDLQTGSDSSKRLSPTASDPLHYVFQIKLEKTLRLTPVFVSQHGLSNLRPPTCQVIVYADRAPDVAIISPEREISLRPTDQVTIEFAARDDFGVVRAELVAFVGDHPDLENALVVPPTIENETKNSKAVTDAKAAAGETKNAPAPAGPQSKAAGANAAPAAKQASPSTSPANGPKSASDGKAEAARRRGTPPQTLVMPIPLAGQTGEKNVRGKIKLDLRQFQLKQGQQLQYMVRVYDSRSARSNGQSYGDSLKSAPSKSPASTAKSAAKQPSTAQSTAQSTPAATAEQKAAAEKRREALRQQAIANGQESKNPTTGMINPPASPTSPKGPPTKSKSDGVADAAKIDTSAARQDSQTADRKDPAGSKPSPSAANQQGSESSPAQPARASAKKETAPPEESAGRVTGAPPPKDSMTKRQLDVDSQSTASSTMKIHIDKWAGSFEGQQRRKLEILIDPVLKELDAALAKAIEELRPVSDALAQAKKPSDDFKKPFARGRHTNCTRPIAGGRPCPKIGRHALRFHRSAAGRHHRVAHFTGASRCEGGQARDS